MDAKQFITNQLASTGWAPIHAGLAKMLAPDTANASRDFAAFLYTPASLLRIFHRTALTRASVPGFGEVVILYRSPVALADRIGLIVGGEVELIRDAELEALTPAAVVPAAKLPKPVPKREDTTAARIALARQEPLGHDCDSRREILKARAELDAAGIEWQPA
jgi:hypothetical protein